MKRRNGFTLVELLAVIAILAILVIIALPNVLRLFNDARMNTFQTEVQTIFNTAQQEFLLNGGKPVKYYRKGGNACKDPEMKSLSLKGTSVVDYYIDMDVNGHIIEYHITDESYSFTYTKADDEEGLRIEEVGNKYKVVEDDTSKTTDDYNTVVNSISGKCEEQ